MTGTWGRDAELAAVATCLAEARAGAGRVVVVEGPAGIGKTTLLGAAAAAAPRDMAVLRARGDPLERDFAYGIARQIFTPVRETPVWDHVCRGAAARAAQVLADDPPPADSRLEAVHVATHALYQLTVQHAGHRPTALFVDDAHWADPPSLRWLAGLARRLEDRPIALVLAIRTGEPAAEPGLLDELLATATAVRPGPLDPVSTAALVTSRRPGATPAFTRSCHDRTGGNPFLLTLLLDEAVPDTGSPPVRISRWVGQHLSRLPAGAGDLARALAVLGPSATLRHAAGLAGVDTGRAALLTDAMRAAGLLRPGSDPALAHPIVAAALYDSMGAGLRGLQHARAARMLAAEGDDPERAALHLLRSPPTGDPVVTRFLHAAAGHATARGAPEVAVTFLRRALAEPPGDRTADTAIRLDLALALTAGRQPGAAETAHDVVAGIEGPADRADAVLRCGRALALTGEQEPAVALYRLVLDEPTGVPAATLARIEAEWSANASTDARTRPHTPTPTPTPAPGPAPAPAPAPGGSWVVLHPLECTSAQDRRASGRVAGDRRARDRGGIPEFWRVGAMTEATFAGRPPAECLALITPLLDSGALAAEADSLLPTASAVMLVAGGHLDRVLAIGDAMITDARARGWPSTVAHGRFLRALALLPAGSVTEAAAEAGASLAFKISTGTTPAAARLWALAPLVDALVEADQTDRAEALIGVAEPPPHTITAPMFLQSRARLRLAQDRPAEALADLLEARARWSGLRIVHPAMASWPADAVRACRALDRHEEADAFAREHLAAARRTGAPHALGAALRAAALAGSRTDRVGLLEESVRVTAGTTARLQHAYALCDLGSALRRDGRRAAARTPLLAALEIADAGGAVRLAGRARAEVQAAGARPRRAAQHGAGALTDAEQQVVRLAAGGLTNREISARLTLSRRTVETHLAHAYRKLEISSRTELAKAMETTVSK